MIPMSNRSFIALMIACAASVAGCGDDEQPIQDDAAVDPCGACSPTATCDPNGSPVCACPAGFTGDGTIAGTGCTDIDECTQNECVDAASGGTCTNTSGSVTCGCMPGYTGDGTQAGTGCTNVDECAADTDDCLDTSAGGICTDTPGGFTCGCATGYTGDGTASGTGCTNIDECAMGTDNCVDAAAGGTCMDTAGGFTCGCATGFTGDGLPSGTGCTDVDECAADAEACGYAACSNTIGSFSCSVIYTASPFQNFGWVIHPTSYEVIGSFESTLSGSSVGGITSFTTDPTTGTHYAIAKVDGNTARVLVTVDFQPGVANLTQVGNLGDKFASLAFREDGQLFGVTGDGATVPEALYLIDKATATTTLATTLGNGADGEAIVYNPDDDHFYHFSGNGTVVYEKVESTPPYTVTNIPISGVTNGETFGGMYLGGGQILISNIASGFNVVGTDGTWGPKVGAFPDDVRGVIQANVSPNAFRVSPSTVSSAGGDTVTVTGSFCSDTSGFSIGPTSVAATLTPNQITFTTPATPAGTQVLTASGGSSGASHIGTLTFVDPTPRLITDTGNGDDAPASTEVEEVGCSAGTSESLGVLSVLALAIIPRRRRRRR